MGRLTNLLLARRDASPDPLQMIGFPSDGGLLAGGVTGVTALGLSSVWRCLDIISNGVSQLPWTEKFRGLELPRDSQSPIVVHPLGFGTRREWTSYVVSVLALYDVAYLLKLGDGPNLGLLPIDPSSITPKQRQTMVSPFLPIETYFILGVEVPADRLVILHRSPTPGVWDTQGGVIRLARVTFAAALAAEGYASRYWQAGGSPTTVLESDAQIPDAIATQISDRWRERRSKGPDYAPLLSGGVKARDFGADPLQSAAVEARKEQVADIGRYFGIPTTLLNAPAGDSETYGTSEAQGIHLVTYTLANYINAVEDAITSLLPDGHEMVINPGKLQKTTQLAQAQALQLATGGKAWVSVDEARLSWDLGPAETPDELNPAPSPQPTPAFGGATDVP